MIDADSLSKMRGWHKLKETILQSDPPSSEPLRSSPNSHVELNLFNGTSSEQQDISGDYGSTIHNNGYAGNSPDTDQSDVLSEESLTRFHSPSVISLASSPRSIIEGLQLSEVESLPASPGRVLRSLSEEHFGIDVWEIKPPAFSF